MSKTKFDIDETRANSIDAQGHRGARARFPENTLPAFQHALAVGADTLEMDLGVTSDGILVVHHDPHINLVICKYKNGKSIERDLRIHSLTLKQIKSFDCGSKPNPRFPNQKLIPGTEIPTLDEVFNLVKKSNLPNAKTIRFNIETKSEEKYPDRQPDPKTFAHLVLKAIEKHELLERVTIQSFDHRTLIEARKLNPTISLAALFEEKPKDFVKATQAAKAQIISPDFELITKADVKKLHAAGIAVIPWTVNTEVDWLHVIELGVDGIITDDPEALLRFLNRL